MTNFDITKLDQLKDGFLTDISVAEPDKVPALVGFELNEQIVQKTIQVVRAILSLKDDVDIKYTHIADKTGYLCSVEQSIRHYKLFSNTADEVFLCTPNYTWYKLKFSSKFAPSNVPIAQENDTSVSEIII